MKDAKMQLLILANIMTNPARQAENDFATEDKRGAVEECYSCVHRRDVPGNAHIECVKPDAEMIGSPHGIREGWFMYPLLFDPVWKRKRCSNHEPIDKVNPAVSNAVSRDE